MKNVLKPVTFFASIALMPLCRSFSVAGADGPPLEVAVNGSTQTTTPAQLARQIKMEELNVYNPAYKGAMTYHGFWLDEILQTLRIQLGERDVVVQCADGYATSLDAAEIGHHNWLLAFEEKGGGWTPLPGHQVALLPSTWYLVGRNPESFRATPWPYDVVQLNIQKSW